MTSAFIIKELRGARALRLFCGRSSFPPPSYQIPTLIGWDFFAWNASIGAVSGHGLESGGWFRSPVFALSRLSVLCFSLLTSRAFARLPPGFMRISGRWVVVGHCMDGATEGRATKENGLQAVPGAGCETGRTQPQTAAGHGRLTLLLSAPSSGGITAGVHEGAVRPTSQAILLLI